MTTTEGVPQPMPSLQPLEVHSLADQVLLRLRRSIVSGQIAPGQSLSLRKLADVLGVSVIPVRDALKVLETEGLVVNPPGRSATVVGLDADELQAIYRVRLLLEPDIAERACTRITPGELDRLDDAARELGRPFRSMADIYEEHNQFHRDLLRPAASVWDDRILTMLWSASERYLRIGLGLLDPDPLEHLRREESHRVLVAQFRTQDPAHARSAVREHLEQTRRIALEALSIYQS